MENCNSLYWNRNRYHRSIALLFEEKLEMVSTTRVLCWHIKQFTALLVLDHYSSNYYRCRPKVSFLPTQGKCFKTKIVYKEKSRKGTTSQI